MSNFNKPYNRRKGPDILVKWVQWASGIAWILFIAIFMTTLVAKPDIETMFDQMFAVHIRSTWDNELMSVAFILMIILFIFCLVSIAFNYLRRRRKTDRIHKSLIFLTFLSFIGILISLYMFI